MSRDRRATGVGREKGASDDEVTGFSCCNQRKDSVMRSDWLLRVRAILGNGTPST
jgi:hypothetical protein